MQKECEKQLKRINKEIEDFESRKERDVEELAIWKDEQITEVQKEKDGIEKERADLNREKETSSNIIISQSTKSK